jgi:hypothetical protein
MQLIYRYKYPNLDDDLHNLAEKCSNGNRPTLAELLGQVQNAVATKTGPQHFLGKPFAFRESDQQITEIIKKTMSPKAEAS